MVDVSDSETRKCRVHVFLSDLKGIQFVVFSMVDVFPSITKY